MDFLKLPFNLSGEEEIQYYLDKVDIDREALAKECSQNVCKISVERLPLSKLPVQPVEKPEISEIRSQDSESDGEIILNHHRQENGQNGQSGQNSAEASETEEVIEEDDEIVLKTTNKRSRYIKMGLNGVKIGSKWLKKVQNDSKMGLILMKIVQTGPNLV